MTPLEMIEYLASLGYKSCWYARVKGGHGEGVPHFRVTSLEDGGFEYLINNKPGTRDDAQAVLDEYALERGN